MSEQATSPLTEAQQRRGMRLVYTGQAFGAIQTQLLFSSAIGVLLIKHLGGTDFQAMLLAPMLMISRVLQIPVSLRVRPSRGKRFMLRCWLATGIAVGAAVAVTLVPLDPSTKVACLLGFLAVGAVLQTCGMTFWFPLLHDVVPGQIRGRFFGRMRTILSASSFVAILLAGWFLGSDPELWRFQIVIAAGLGLYLIRNLFITHLPEIDGHADDNYSDWKRYVRQLLSRREVLVFCVYFSLLTFAAGFLNTPLVLYMEHMGFDVSDNVITFSFKALGQILSLLAAGVLVDRIGTKRVFGLAHVGLCLVCVAVIGIGFLSMDYAKVLMPLAMIASGGMLAVAHIACTAQLFHLAPDHGRAFFMSLALILLSYGAALSPILAGAVKHYAADELSLTIGGITFDPFQIILAAAAAGMLILLVFLRFVQDIHPSRDRQRSTRTGERRRIV